jgi:hypothetical protein
MLNRQTILPDTQFALKINAERFKLPVDIEQEIEALWVAEKSRQGKDLFNGFIFSASQVGDDGIDGAIVAYRYFLAQQRRPELFEILQIRPVAVSGLLVCPDGVIFGRRARSVMQDAGLWELVPSGGIDTNKLIDISQVDYISQILTELHQEVGINSDSITKINPFCLVDDSDSHVLDIGIAMQTLLFFDEVQALHRDKATNEYEQLRVIPMTEVSQVIQWEASQFVGVSTVLLQQFSLISANS